MTIQGLPLQCGGGGALVLPAHALWSLITGLLTPITGPDTGLFPRICKAVITLFS